MKQITYRVRIKGINSAWYSGLSEAEAARFTANIYEIEMEESTNDRLGRWLSAALDDPNVCVEMKTDIRAWMEQEYGSPNASIHDEQPIKNAMILSEIKHLALNCGSAGYLSTPKTLARIVHLCIVLARTVFTSA